MRRIAHLTAWFTDADVVRLRELMRSQSSAVRSAYQGVKKHGLKGNELVKHVKRNYMASLSQRYVADACVRGATITHDDVVFGGKQTFADMHDGKISKEEWLRLRNNQLWSRGDRAFLGNPNIRVVGEEMWVNDPSRRGLWIKGKLFVPKKWRGKIDLSCYDAKVIDVGTSTFKVQVGWDAEPAPIITSRGRGVLGVDTNPDGCAVVETDSHGNLRNHSYVGSQRLEHAQKDKRQYDVRMVAKEVVAKAVETGKSLVVEKLSLKKKAGHKKFKRMQHNFLHRQLIEAIHSRAAREGVEVVEVNPAFTSVLGVLKYKDMYSLNRHTAAALVIGRRGLEFKERQDFTVGSSVRDGRRNLEGRGRSVSLSDKALSWMLGGQFVRAAAPSAPVDLTSPGPAPYALRHGSQRGSNDSPDEPPLITAQGRLRSIRTRETGETTVYANYRASSGS